MLVVGSARAGLQVCWLCLPPKPVAKPTVPSVASTSTKNEPNTLIPQLVLEVRYFSHFEQGVEIGESINLKGQRKHRLGRQRRSLPMPPLHIVIVAACYLSASNMYVHGNLLLT